MFRSPQSIGAKVMSTIQGVEAVTSFVEAQHSANGGVMILVEGTMKKQVNIRICSVVMALFHGWMFTDLQVPSFAWAGR